MDAEALKSLGWIIVWGVLLFFIMRSGCGAHIGGHRHGGHAGHEPPGAPPETKDPVCGMDVDPQRAAAASVYRGRTYYFCSASCREKFEQSPEKYVSGPGTQAQQQHGGHHHG